VGREKSLGRKIKKYASCTFHHIAGKPCPAEFYEIWHRGLVIDVITYVKLLVSQFKGYRVLTLQIPTDLLCRPYNSVRTAVRQCDTSVTDGQNTGRRPVGLPRLRKTSRGESKTWQRAAMYEVSCGVCMPAAL